MSSWAVADPGAIESQRRWAHLARDEEELPEEMQPVSWEEIVCGGRAGAAGGHEGGGLGLMELTGGQKKQLREALQAAFQTWNALARMIDEELGVPLNTVAPEGQPMPDVVYAVIRWAQANGRVPELLEKACAANPGNPELIAVKAIFTMKGGE